MKHLITALAIIFLLDSCSEDISKEDTDTESSTLRRKDVYINNMHYVLYANTIPYGTAMIFINLTLDSLQYEYFKKQITSNK